MVAAGGNLGRLYFVVYVLASTVPFETPTVIPFLVYLRSKYGAIGTKKYFVVPVLAVTKFLQLVVTSEYI